MRAGPGLSAWPTLSSAPASGELLEAVTRPSSGAMGVCTQCIPRRPLQGGNALPLYLQMRTPRFGEDLCMQRGGGELSEFTRA